MIAQRKFAVSNDYKALTPATVCAYLAGYKSITQRLGGKSESWKAREVGDVNLNLVFIVDGEKSTVIVKHALPYVRMVGESWPLPLDRAHTHTHQHQQALVLFVGHFSYTRPRFHHGPETRCNK